MLFFLHQVSDEKVASALGVSVGLYSVQTKPVKEDPFRYKLLTADPSTCNSNTMSNKRTVEKVSAEDLIEVKRDKLNEASSALNDSRTSNNIAAKVLPGHTLLKPSLLSAVEGSTKPAVANNSITGRTQDTSSITVSATQTLKSYPTGSIHHMAQLPTQVDTTSSEGHDFKTADESLVVSSAAMDSHEARFLDSHSSTSPMFSVCFVSSSSVMPSTTTDGKVAVDAVREEDMHEQCPEGEEQHQLLEHSEMLKVHTQQYIKDDDHLLGESSQLLQQSDHSLEQPDELLEQANQHEEHQQPIPNVDESLQHSDQLQEQIDQQEKDSQQPMEQLEQSLQQSEQLLTQSEQLEVHVEQQMECLVKSQKEQTQGIEEHDELLKEPTQLLEHTSELSEPNDGMVEDSGQFAGEFQLDASQLTAGVPISVPSGGLNYGSQYVDSDMSQHFVSDGMILADQGNGHMLLQENELVDQSADQTEQAGSVEDLNADNRLILIKNPDGTIQVHRQGNQPISLEELQALLGMELDANLMLTESSGEVLQ